MRTQKMNNDGKLAILVFELGNLQVYHYQTLTEWNSKVPPLEYFWHKKNETKSFGPFMTVYAAVNDYSRYIATPQQELPKNIIQVDFKTKKRLNV